MSMSSGLLGRRFVSVAATAIIACTGLLVLQGSMVYGAEPEPGYLGGFGPDGTATSDFQRVGSVAVNQESGSLYVADTAAQELYKFNEDGQPLNFEGIAPYLDKNSITGLTFNDQNGKSQVAVDSAAKVIYLTSGSNVRAFDEDGEPHIFSEGPGLGTSELFGATELAGVAVDATGNIYASDFSGKIRIYAASGAPLTEFEPSNGLKPANLAVTPTGDLLAIDWLNNVGRRYIPSEFPVTGATTYSPDPLPLDENYTMSVGVDPTTGFIYLGELVDLNRRVAALTESGEFIGSLGGEGQDGELQGRPLGLAVRGGKRVYVGVRTESTTPEHSKVEMFEPFRIFVGRPTVSATSATALSSTSAELRARINPNTLATGYQFEYGSENCDANPGGCTAIAASGGLGAGHDQVPVAQAVSALNPDTTYFYRVIAENLKGVTVGPLRTFTTQRSDFGFELSDSRVWEQVTPMDKFGGGITNGTLVQASADGSAIAFPTRGSIVVDPDGNRALEASAVISRRMGASWKVNDLVPTYTKATGAGLGPEYKLFNTGLDKAVLEPRDESPLSFEASERTAYLRSEGNPPTFRPIVTSKDEFANVASGTTFGGEINGAKNPIALSGANSDLSGIVISSETPLRPGAEKRALYYWQDGVLAPVSELPGAEGKLVTGQVGSGVTSVRHAVSNDGTRVFWGLGEPSFTIELTALYLRDTVLEETFRVDKPQPGVSGPGDPHPVFAGASADGSVVFFTDSQQLTADANLKGRDLYRCEIGNAGVTEGCADLVDLSASAVGSEQAEAEEVAALSEDGATVYFVARGVLASDPNRADENAQAEAPNLYVWQDGIGIRFITTLSEGDGADWGKPRDLAAGQLSGTSMYSSPSGRFLTFMSERNLAGDESDDPETGEPAEQIFLYDSKTNGLGCVSCNPYGGTDAAHQIVKGTSEGGLLFPDLQGLWAGRFVSATLPESTESEPTKGYSFYQPRAVLDNGRVFYNSLAPLVPADSNGTWDVYQYEPLGVGSCSPLAGSVSVSLSGDGCVGLISSGTDSNASVFLDASESGDDLFFMTFAPLSALDSDSIVDVYDARVNGLEARSKPISECQGEACKAPPPVPSDTPPASSGFNGAGNMKPNPGKRCRKGQRKVRRHGKVKCVKKHAKKTKRHSGAGK
jgi:hypothetical protein